MTIRSATILLIILSSLTGCADRATFVTDTFVGIDADITTRKAQIGYGRTWSFVGPSYSTGAIPPAVGQMNANLAIFTPKIEQLYATGDAALLATKALESVNPKKFEGKKKIMYFATNSNLGISLAFTEELLPRSISVGYKRKEFSIIPLQKQSPDQPETYGSVLAKISLDLETPNLPKTKMELEEFIATGEAAEAIAKTERVRDISLGQQRSYVPAISPRISHLQFIT
jgi:hypothetical protein